jgi:hypothetical protein
MSEHFCVPRAHIAHVSRLAYTGMATALVTLCLYCNGNITACVKLKNKNKKEEL